MECALCTADTKVARTVVIPDGLKRDRLCTNGHRYQTIETSIGWRLEDAQVRNGDGRIGGPFDRDLLRDDVVESTFLRVSEDRAEQIVSGTVDMLRRRIREEGVLSRGTRRGKTGDPQTLLLLDVGVIRDTVEAYLNSEGHHMLHVLYAMDFRGRTDRRRKGWRRAEDVVTWLEEAYPELGSTETGRTLRQSVHKEEWTPRATAWNPRFVVKQPSGADSQRTTDVFRYKQFLASVRKAMVGRPESTQIAQYITWLVLRPLAGQSVVTTSQLGVGVLNYLRQIDDIAYLRWATIVKNIVDIETFHAEARGLVANPSPRLSFTKHIAPPVEFDRIEPEQNDTP